jgi:hypothetical protein
MISDKPCYQLLNTKRFENGYKFYLLPNCTKPHPFPTGILTETISPYWENGCLRSSAVALGSSPPTNIYNASWKISEKLFFLKRNLIIIR